MNDPERNRAAHSAKPSLAVWKFASCDGCQLTLLNCEDELLAIADAIGVAHFTEASSEVLARGAGHGHLPDPPSVDVPPAEAAGYGATEPPRGMLYHRYRITSGGTITDAKIVPPTSQNLRVIEADLRGVLSRTAQVRTLAPEHAARPWGMIGS